MKTSRLCCFKDFVQPSTKVYNCYCSSNCRLVTDDTADECVETFTEIRNCPNLASSLATAGIQRGTFCNQF